MLIWVSLNSLDHFEVNKLVDLNSLDHLEVSKLVHLNSLDHLEVSHQVDLNSFGISKKLGLSPFNFNSMRDL